MNYGLYLSANGALTGMHRQDVIANNLANSRTVGFKPDEVFLRERLPERLASAEFAGIDSPELLELLGGGHHASPTRPNLAQGNLTETGNDLDLAIRGDGFFTLQSSTGSGDRMRYTRDGRFTLNSQSELVLAANGMRILDSSNRPIRITPGAPIAIDSAGSIKQGDSEIAKIQLASLPAQSIRKVGDNLFALDGAVPAKGAVAIGHIAQRHIEESAVDPILTLNAMINATKSVQANLKMIQFHDTLMDQSINRLGRVA